MFLLLALMMTMMVMMRRMWMEGFVCPRAELVYFVMTLEG